MSKKITFICAAAMATLFLTIPPASCPGQTELEIQQQAYLDAGGILEPAKFAPPLIPDAENAAIAMEPSLTFFQTLSDEECELIGDDDRLDEQMVAALLAKCQPAIKALRTTAALPQCRWNIDYAAGIEEQDLSHLGRTRRAARVLAMNVRVNALHENHDKIVIQDIETILRLGVHLTKNPTLVGQLVASSVLQMGCMLYRDMFLDHSAPPNKIGDILANLDRNADLRRTLQMEILLAQTTFATLREIRDPDTDAASDAQRRRLLDSDQAYYIRIMRQAIRDSAKRYHEVPRLPDSPEFASTSRLLIPPVGRLRFAYGRTEATFSLLSTAETLRAYKGEHGAYPEPGVIEMPIDPLNGKPFVYRVHGNGFSLMGSNGSPELREAQWDWEN